MYPTTKELVDGSTVEALTSLEEAQQDALREEAIAAVERYCRQSFLQEGTEEDPVERILDGSGSRALYLPKRLITLTDLDAGVTGLAVGDVVLSERRDRLVIADEPSGSTWATRAIAEMTGTRDPIFPSGLAGVRIVGVWGWEAVPAEVTTALRFDMEDRALAGVHKLADTVQSARALGVASVRQGNLSIDLGGRQPTVSLRVRRALSGLRWSTGGSGALA